MNQRYRINSIKDVDLKGGYLIDGFPSTGHTSAIASASMIQAAKLEAIATIDSDKFPPVSLIDGAKPFHPTRVFASTEHKTAIFSSYLALPPQEHKSAARLMLKWARDHEISWIISSVAIKSKVPDGKIIAAASTEAARKKITDAGIEVLKTGIITGIPGALLNYGALGEQNVIVIVFNPTTDGPDFKSSIFLCDTVSKLVPGMACDVSTLQTEAARAQTSMQQAQEQTDEGNLKTGMFG